MSTSKAAANTGAGQLNKLAVLAIVLAGVAIWGIWLLGIGALAVFAVGAGHVSLGQIKQTGGRGQWLAVAALVIGYAIASWALFSALKYIPALIQ